MKKIMLMLFTLFFVLSTGCAFLIRDHVHDERRNKEGNDGRVYKQAEDDHRIIEKNDPHRKHGDPNDKKEHINPEN